MNQIQQKISSFVLIISILCSSFFSVSATQVNTALIDKAKTGSVTIYNYAISDRSKALSVITDNNFDYITYLKSVGANPIQDVTFKLTQVVGSDFKNGKGEIYYNGTEVSIPNVDDVKTSLKNGDGVFKEIESFTLTPTDADGKTMIKGLPLGFYLVQEVDEPASMIERVADYILSVPMTSSDGTKWNYDITTYPKAVNGVVLTYDANNGSGQSFSEPRMANKTENLTENPFTNGSKVFLGWADDATATIPTYIDKQSFTMPEHDKTLYAVWAYTSLIRYYTDFKYSEPWGLKFSFALLNPNTQAVIDYSKYDNYGMYVLAMNEEDTEMPSMSEVIVNGIHYSNKNTEFKPVSLTFNDGNTNDYLTMTYDKDIYTQNLADDIYVLTYVTYKGRTFWGTVRNRCVLDSIDGIIESKQVGLTTFTNAEVQLAKAIKKMYLAEKEYFLNNDSESIAHPKPKSINAYSLSEGENTQFNFLTSLRAIAPWGFKLSAAPVSDTLKNDNNYGCIVYEDRYRQFDTMPTVAELKALDGTVVYSNTDGSASYESVNGRNFITCYHIGIDTYRLAQTDVYTCFYYEKDGKYYYSPVMKRNCYDFAQEGVENNNGALAGDVYEAMIELYKETYYYRNGYYPEKTDHKVNYQDEKNYPTHNTTETTEG